MMKTLAFLIGNLFFAVAAYAQTNVASFDVLDGLEKYSHYGKVDTVIEYNYRATVLNGEPAKGNEDYGKAKTIVAFNHQGQVVAVSDFISLNSRGNTYLYEYDRKGRLTERRVLNEKSDTVAKILISYTSSKLIEKSFFGKDQAKPLTTWIFEFDKGGRTVARKKIYPAGDEQVHTVYELGEDGAVLKKTTDTYYWNYKYTPTGRLLEEEQYVAFKVDDGQPLRPAYKNTYTYNEHAAITGIQKVSGRSEKVIRYEYTFDENNNWIKRIEFEDGKPKLITERTILYRQ